MELMQPTDVKPGDTVFDRGEPVTVVQTDDRWGQYVRVTDAQGRVMDLEYWHLTR